MYRSLIVPTLPWLRGITGRAVSDAKALSGAAGSLDPVGLSTMPEWGWVKDGSPLSVESGLTTSVGSRSASFCSAGWDSSRFGVVWVASSEG